MERFDMDHTSLETDINGVCNTDYLLNGAQESSLVIDKNKDINTCQNRYQHHSILQTVPYHFRSVRYSFSIFCFIFRKFIFKIKNLLRILTIFLGLLGRKISLENDFQNQKQKIVFDLFQVYLLLIKIYF